MGHQWDLVGRTYDMESAYRQLSINPKDGNKALIGVYDQKTGKVRVFRMGTMPFGAVASVYAFLRTAAAVNHIANLYAEMSQLMAGDGKSMLGTHQCVMLPPERKLIVAGAQVDSSARAVTLSMAVEGRLEAASFRADRHLKNGIRLPEMDELDPLNLSTPFASRHPYQSSIKTAEGKTVQIVVDICTFGDVMLLVLADEVNPEDSDDFLL